MWARILGLNFMLISFQVYTILEGPHWLVRIKVLLIEYKIYKRLSEFHVMIDINASIMSIKIR